MQTKNNWENHSKIGATLGDKSNFAKRKTYLICKIFQVNLSEFSLFQQQNMVSDFWSSSVQCAKQNILWKINESNFSKRKTSLISAILVPPLPMMQPISSLGTVISCVWAVAPLGIGARSCDPGQRRKVTFVDNFWRSGHFETSLKMKCSSQRFKDLIPKKHCSNPQLHFIISPLNKWLLILIKKRHTRQHFMTSEKYSNIYYFATIQKFSNFFHSAHPQEPPRHLWCWGRRAPGQSSYWWGIPTRGGLRGGSGPACWPEGERMNHYLGTKMFLEKTFHIYLCLFHGFFFCKTFS